MIEKVQALAGDKPISVASGGAYRLGSAKLHLTGEWFAPVDEFVVLPGIEVVRILDRVAVDSRFAVDRLRDRFG